MRRVWFRFILIALAPLSLFAAATTTAHLVGRLRAAAYTAPPPSLTAHGYAAPGNTMRIEGEWFIPGETATIYYDSTALTTVKVIQTISIVGKNVGGFSVPVVVPTDTTTGAHTFQAIAQPGGLTAQTAVTVKANWAQYGFAATNTRYNPYETAITTANVASLTPAWTVTDPNGFSTFTFNTPSVADGNLYYMTNIDNTTYAANATTGASIWSAQFNSYSTGSGEPAVVAGSLYTTGYYLTAQSTSTGNTSWMNVSTYNVSSAPTVADGYIYVTMGGSVEAFSASGCGQYNCNPVWTYTDALGGIEGTPAVANGLLYVGTTVGGLIVLNATTGSLQWTARVSTASGVGAGNPMVDDGMVFIGVGALYTTTATLAAYPAAGCGASKCSALWTAAVGQGFGQGVADNLAAANGVVFVSSTDWNLYAFAESGCGSATCSPLWKGATGGMIESAPAIANGVVYVGSDDHDIHAFPTAGCGTATCQPIWAYDLGNEVESSPIVVNGMVYITARSGELYAFHLPTSSKPRPTGRPALR